jgi:hypothetical protein
MIKLTVHGLATVQCDNLVNALLTRVGLHMPMTHTVHPDGTWGLTVEGRENCVDLVRVLTDEDSGADYLV